MTNHQIACLVRPSVSLSTGFIFYLCGSPGTIKPIIFNYSHDTYYCSIFLGRTSWNKRTQQPAQFSCAPPGKINVYFLNTVYLLVWLHFLKDNLKRFIPTLVSHLLLVRLALLTGGLFPAGLKAFGEGGARELMCVKEALMISNES